MLNEAPTFARGASAVSNAGSPFQTASGCPPPPPPQPPSTVLTIIPTARLRRPSIADFSIFLPRFYPANVEACLKSWECRMYDFPILILHLVQAGAEHTVSGDRDNLSGKLLFFEIWIGENRSFFRVFFRLLQVELFDQNGWRNDAERIVFR